MTFDNLLIERDDAVAVVTFNRPKVLNALNTQTLTELSADKTWGVVRGSGVERYILADGRKYDLKTRWTATVAKETDGKWRLRTIHIGTNFLDNPILAEAEGAVVKVGVAGGVGGLVLGLLIALLITRVRRRKQQ